MPSRLGEFYIGEVANSFSGGFSRRYCCSPANEKVITIHHHDVSLSILLDRRGFCLGRGGERRKAGRQHGERVDSYIFTVL